MDESQHQQPPALGEVQPREATSVEMVRVLVEDPGLAESLPASMIEHATRAAIAPVLHLKRGTPSFASEDPSISSHLGLLVLDGLIVRHVVVGQIASSEVLGRRDMLRPSLRFPSQPEIRVHWDVLAPARIAVLDQDFAYRVRAWPQIATVLLDRTQERTDSQLLLSALRQARRVEDRVLLALWHLADRMGEATPGGMLAPTANLTGEILARIVGARRQSVSTALGALADRGAIMRCDDGSVVIPKRPSHLLGIQPQGPARGRAARRPVGDAAPR